MAFRIEPQLVAKSARTLRILAFSDCRVQDLKTIVSWVRDHSSKPDLIIYAGDDVGRFVPTPEENYFEQLASLSRYGIAAVVGNDDPPHYRTLIRGRKVYEVHSQPIIIGRFLITGIEGAPILKDGKNLGFTLYEESEIAHHLSQSTSSSENYTVILVSHTPPRGCLDEAMRHNTGQIGSTAVREFVEAEPSVALVVSGHVHLCGGRHDSLDHTMVLNAASDDKAGKPARIATMLLRADGSVEDLQWTNVSSRFQLAAEIQGISHVYAARLALSGIVTVEQLAESSPEVVGQALGWNPEKAAIFIARAQSLLQGQPILVSALELPKQPRLYLDIETDLQQSYTWLAGIATENSDNVHQFFAPHPSKENEMLHQLATFLAARENSSVLHFSGTQFDRRVLLARMESHGIAPPKSLLQSVDCLGPLRQALALPSPTFGLKEAVACFGYRFTYPELDGFGVAYAYQQAVHFGKPIPEHLLAYNRDDVLALRFLIQKAERFAFGLESGA